MYPRSFQLQTSGWLSRINALSNGPLHQGRHDSPQITTSLRNIFVCGYEPRHVLHLKQFVVACSEMRKHDLCGASAVLHLFIPIDTLCS